MKRTIVAALAFALLAPLAADAQRPSPTGTQLAWQTDAVSPEQADRLSAEAYRLFADRKTWRRAARLLEKAAEMRDAADAARVDELLAAARVYGHVGATDDALRAFEAAGEAAAARGAVADAAHAFLDAAIAAVRAGNGARAHALIEKSVLLSESPHLEAPARQAIRRRVVTAARG